MALVADTVVIGEVIVGEVVVDRTLVAAVEVVVVLTVAVDGALTADAVSTAGTPSVMLAAWLKLSESSTKSLPFILPS